jgi:hypothetical protein
MMAAQKTQSPTVLNDPMFLWLEITAKCNLLCEHCYADSGPQADLYGNMTTACHSSHRRRPFSLQPWLLLHAQHLRPRLDAAPAPLWAPAGVPAPTTIVLARHRLRSKWGVATNEWAAAC